jgi:hypothetical protein
MAPASLRLLLAALFSPGLLCMVGSTQEITASHLRHAPSPNLPLTSVPCGAPTILGFFTPSCDADGLCTPPSLPPVEVDGVVWTLRECDGTCLHSLLDSHKLASQSTNSAHAIRACILVGALVRRAQAGRSSHREASTMVHTCRSAQFSASTNAMHTCMFECEWSVHTIK